MECLKSYNPATGEEVGEVPVTPVAEIPAIVARARAAQSAWAALGLEGRAELLAKAADVFGERVEKHAELITTEMGKPLNEAVYEAKSLGGGLARELDEIVEALAPDLLDDGRARSTVYHDPLGVVGAITPWNFPMSMPSWMIIPALGAGNTVVFKPSEETPLCGQAYADALNEVLPDDVLIVVHGADDQGKALVQSDVDMIAFTGSREVGKHIMREASGNLKRVVLELGGKDPMIVLDDADVVQAAKFAAANSFRNAGQVCVATERIFVLDSVAEEFEKALAEAASTMKVGPGLEGSDVGPMVNARQRDHVLAQVEAAVSAGARVLAGGSRAPRQLRHADGAVRRQGRHGHRVRGDVRPRGVREPRGVRGRGGRPGERDRVRTRRRRVRRRRGESGGGGPPAHGGNDRHQPAGHGGAGLALGRRAPERLRLSQVQGRPPPIHADPGRNAGTLRGGTQPGREAMSEIPRGRFCWYELMTTDPAAAPDFYHEIAGWGAAPFDGASTPYTMWLNGEVPIGGFMRLPEPAARAGAPSHWMAHVSTPDVDATTSKAIGLGAELIHREAIAVGEFAIMKDPQGAVFAAFQPAGDAPGHDGSAALGEMSWHELATDDWEAAWDFYSALFDWEKSDAMDMGEMGTYQIFARDGHQVGAMFDRPPQTPMSAWLFYVLVPDVEAAAEKVKALGGQVTRGPMDVPGGRVALCLDPQGAAFAVHAIAHE